MPAEHLELIAFKTCPFCQRVAIILEEKDVPYKVTYVEEENRPDWLWEISPQGKVPILKIGNSDFLLESLIIVDYLDDTFGPSLRPASPLIRAKNRLLVEQATPVLGALRKFLAETAPQATIEKKEILLQQLKNIESSLTKLAPFVNGTVCQMVDLLLSPTLVRLFFAQKHFSPDLLVPVPRLQALTKTMATHPSVINGLVENFETLWLEAVEKSRTPHKT